MRRFEEINKSHRSSWNIKLEFSILLSLTLLISGFYFFPKMKNKTLIVKKYIEDPIEVIEIDQTRQIRLQKIPIFIKPTSIIRNNVQLPAENIVLTNEVPETMINLENKITMQPEAVNILDDEPFEFYEISERPKIESEGIKLKYPQLARLAGIAGLVEIRALVGKDGLVVSAEIVKSIGGGCDEAALEYVKQLKFKPGMQQDKAVKVWLKIPVKFSLKM